jgi:hypothetical protein
MGNGNALSKSLFREAEAAFPEADEAPLTDHEMIKGFNVQQLASRDDFPCHEDVLNTYMENHLTV